ncbi:MAG: hypothetical protein IPF99_24940 [Deltaproteobacteria bacterium]|nr:hypothetical protein [Deltaproteobacteria bacterium]
MASCTAPFADCNGSASDGCEANTQSDPAHCGACNTACPTRANATATCATAPAASPATRASRTATATRATAARPTPARARSTAAAAAARAPPNATGACVAGACTIVGSCATSYGDCDGNASNGCGVDHSHQHLALRRVRAACPAPANSVPACVGSTCLRTCAVGFDDCDLVESNGCETNLRTSKRTRGRCGQRCSAQQRQRGLRESGVARAHGLRGRLRRLRRNASNGCEGTPAPAPRTAAHAVGRARQ